MPNQQPKKKEFYCMKCEKLLDEMPMEVMNSLFGPKMFYCSNKNCKHYGIVVVAALKERI